jgi:hypothetical protein
MSSVEPRRQYNYLYKQRAWRKVVAQQLSSTPYCEWCFSADKVYVPAEICHHSTPHRGDVYLFYNNIFVSLCKTCHDSEAQQIEKIGYSTRVGVDGLPIDLNHPFYK